MKYKLLRAFLVTLMIACPIITWYMADIVHYLLGTTPRTQNPLFTLSHLWGSQLALCMLCGLAWPIPMPATAKQLFKSWWIRSFALALVGGMVGGWLLETQKWWMPLLLAICGLVQMSLVGLVMGTNLRNPNLEQKTT